MKIHPILIVVALLAYWLGLCNASAFYDPGAQRWLNRDPIDEIGFKTWGTPRIGSGSERVSATLTGDTKNAFVFVVNDPCLLFDPFGLTAKTGDECPDPCDSKWPSGGNIHVDKMIGKAVRDGTFTVDELLEIPGATKDYIEQVAKYYEDVGKCYQNKGKDPRIKKLNDCRAAYLRGERTKPCGNIGDY